MSERGTFCLDRGWFDHPEFAAEPFTEREAWAWLIAQAAYKPHARKVGHVTVNLQRGQLAASLRYMAEKWQWSKSRVERFLFRLTARDSIGTDSGAGVMVVTICNYDTYQPALKVSGTPETEKAGQQRDKEEKRNNRIYTHTNARAREREIFRDEFELWWSSWKHQVKPDAALEAFIAVRQAGADLDTLVTASRLYGQGKPRHREWLNPDTWLRERRWLDKPAEEPASAVTPANGTYRPPVDLAAEADAIRALIAKRKTDHAQRH